LISQVTGELSEINRFRSAVKILKEVKPDSTAFMFEGDPFLSPAFKPGEVIDNDGYKYVNIPLRYNIYNNNFEFLKDEIPYALPAKEFAATILLDNKLFRYSDYLYKGEKSGYLEVISEGRYTLYRLHRVTFEEPKAELAYQDASPGMFRKLSPEYLLSGNEDIPRHFSNKKQFLELYPNKSEEIRSFLRSKKIKFTKESDLILLTEFINGI
jgi:hypothetical protein